MFISLVLVWVHTKICSILSFFFFKWCFYHLWFLQRRKARVKESTRRSGLSRTSVNITAPPQNGPLSPQRPHLIPITPTTSPSLKSSYRSPPELTRVSPTILQQPSPSPSLKLDDLSVQTSPVSQSWLQSSLAPVSPTKSPESDFPTYPNGQNAVKESPYLHSPPLTHLAVDPEAGMQDHGLPPLEWVKPAACCAHHNKCHHDADIYLLEIPKGLVWTE